MEKEEINLSLFEDDMMVYIENPKKSITPQALELITGVSKAAKHKINTQKINHSLYKQ